MSERLTTGCTQWYYWTDRMAGRQRASENLIRSSKYCVGTRKAWKCLDASLERFVSILFLFLFSHCRTPVPSNDRGWSRKFLLTPTLHVSSKSLPFGLCVRTISRSYNWPCNCYEALMQDISLTLQKWKECLNYKQGTENGYPRRRQVSCDCEQQSCNEQPKVM